MAATIRTLALLLVLSVALVVAKKTARPVCETDCGTDYTPVCASDGVNKPITFGNACVMKKVSCEQSKKYTKQNDGECKNGGGVRLS